MYAQIRMLHYNYSYFYNKTEVLKLTIKYPVIGLYNNPYAQLQINNHIMSELGDFLKYASNNLYNEAVKQYQQAQENNYPFHSFEAIMEYVITYNDNCFLSYYNTKYEYTGGAHGITVMHSDTFSLQNGANIPLSCFFRKGVDYKEILIEQIIKQADDNVKNNPGIYFDNYAELIVKNFNENNYFLSLKGLSIYYQQYDIAPYSTGIVIFTIPYNIII